MNILKNAAQLHKLTEHIFSHMKCKSSLPALCTSKELHTNRCNLSDATSLRLRQTLGPSLIDLRGDWPPLEQESFIRDMRIYPEFISEMEEEELLKEIEPYLNRLHYEIDHWDDAIHNFRETERKKWYPTNREVINRVRQFAFGTDIMPYVHVLDLAKDGVIKPHVDSTRYCGDTIAGVSLLSGCVMRLVRTDEQAYKQEPEGSGEANDRQQPKTVSLENTFYADMHLPRRSLYIMANTARYNFTHEVLANENSQFQETHIQKDRRISIICRNEPKPVRGQ